MVLFAGMKASLGYTIVDAADVYVQIVPADFQLTEFNMDNFAAMETLGCIDSSTIDKPGRLVKGCRAGLSAFGFEDDCVLPQVDMTTGAIARRFSEVV